MKINIDKGPVRLVIRWLCYRNNVEENVLTGTCDETLGPFSFLSPKSYCLLNLTKNPILSLSFLSFPVLININI